MIIGINLFIFRPRDGSEKEFLTINARETAPASATFDMYRNGGSTEKGKITILLIKGLVSNEVMMGDGVGAPVRLLVQSLKCWESGAGLDKF